MDTEEHNPTFIEHIAQTSPILYNKLYEHNILYKEIELLENEILLKKNILEKNKKDVFNIFDAVVHFKIGFDMKDVKMDNLENYTFDEIDYICYNKFPVKMDYWKYPCNNPLNKECTQKERKRDQINYLRSNTGIHCTHCKSLWHLYDQCSDYNKKI